MPDLMKYIYANFDVAKSKQYWTNLARKGLEFENSSEVARSTRNGSKCGHCEKKVGKRATIQCKTCFNLNLVECLSDISESFERLSSRKRFIYLQ